MKPQWDKLMEEFKGSSTAVIADVDCTAEGKELCSKNGVRGYPTIKYGEPDALQDYKGGRDFDTLKKFADENLGPSCGPAHVDLCDEDTQKTLNKFLAMDASHLAAAQAEAEKKVAEAQEALTKKFTVHIQKEAGASLGLSIEPVDQYFQINDVRDGAAKAFNAENPGQAVQKDDYIVKVNTAEGDLEKMKEAFKENPVDLVIKRHASAEALAAITKDSGIKFMKAVMSFQANQKKEL